MACILNNWAEDIYKLASVIMFNKKGGGLMFRVNEDTCRFKPRSSKLAWRSSRVPQIVCGSRPLRCGRTVRSMSHGFLLATSTVMHRNDKINTSSNSSL